MNTNAHFPKISKTTRKDKEKETGGDASDPTNPADPLPFLTTATITTKHGKSLKQPAQSNHLIGKRKRTETRTNSQLRLKMSLWIRQWRRITTNSTEWHGSHLCRLYRHKMERVIEGNRGEINNIRTSPTNPGMAKYCLVIFNNPAAHVSKILTVEWSPDGRPLFSGGFDHKIVCWNLAEENVKSHLKKCYKRTKAGRSIENIKDELNMDPRLRLAEKIFENVSRIGASQHRQLVFSDKGRILSLEESDTCPISVLNYELDYNRPSTSGPTTCGPSREVSRCYLHVLRSIGEGNSQNPVDIDDMPMNTVPAFKTRKELSLSMPPASTNPADENITMDQPPVKAHGQDKSSNREYSLHSNEEQPHQNRSGTEKCQKDEVDVGKRRSEPPTTVRAMDNVANSPEEAMDDNMTNGTSSNHVSMTRGRSRGRPIKIKFGWQRSAVNNARQPTSGQPGSQQPRRGVGRPRWNGIRQQSPRLPPTVQTTTNLSESSPTAIRGSKRSWETTKTEHGQSSEGAETAQDAVGSSIQP
ncbi:hypothetical protein L3Y34_013392 [Caenorhabditis briggsae]|uniref:Uncharacterized protein n=1 Tax=Caenorhabditis briggsae TaxID=6238 RepID=A0AAE8ZYB8_CAEBR|nr:hypothetical protein L3Y34_013392 [Caenorhabditis briggsae]